MTGPLACIHISRHPMNTSTPNNSVRAKKMHQLAREKLDTEYAMEVEQQMMAEIDPPGAIWLREAQASVRYEEDSRVMAAEFSRNFQRALNLLFINGELSAISISDVFPECRAASRLMKSDPQARNVVFAAVSDVIDESYRRLNKEEIECFENIILNLLAVLSLNTLYTQTAPLQIADILILPPGVSA